MLLHFVKLCEMLQFVSLLHFETVCYTLLEIVTICYILFIVCKVCYIVLHFDTLRYNVLQCVAVCYRLFTYMVLGLEPKASSLLCRL